MTGVKGRSGTVHNEAEREDKARAAKLATIARVANRQARVAAVIANQADTEDDDQTEDAPLDAIDDDGNRMPRPSRSLRDYADGESERQLAWTRYQAGRARALDVQTKLRQRILISEVREWCDRVHLAINRRLPQLQSLPDLLPGATEDQKTWLRQRVTEFDRSYREDLAREVIE